MAGQQALPALGSLVALGALAACGRSAAGQGAPTPAARPVTVRLATDWLSGPRGDTMQMAIPAFQERRPDVKVAVEAITGEYFTAINTRLAAGTIQEVVLFEGNFFQSYKDQGAFTAIDAAVPTRPRRCWPIKVAWMPSSGRST